MPRVISSTAHPIRTLNDYTQSLEATILAVIGEPGKKAVHKLRTTTRRIEAQLQLLALLPNLPPHQKQARKAARLLKEIRRAAGKVRDLDIQFDLVASEAAGRHNGSSIRREAATLCRDLKLQREEQAERLQHFLEKHHSKFARILERLLAAFEPAESLPLSEADLTSIVRDWYGQRIAALTPDGNGQLHDIRKRAKLARYLAESAPRSAFAARRLAAQFENLQQAGGQWHDWLLLHEQSASVLGKSASLSRRFSS